MRPGPLLESLSRTDPSLPEAEEAQLGGGPSKEPGKGAVLGL